MSGPSPFLVLPGIALAFGFAECVALGMLVGAATLGPALGLYVGYALGWYRVRLTASSGGRDD